MIGVALTWLWDLARAWFAILAFCGFLGLVGVLWIPLMLFWERLEERYGVDDG